MSEEPRIKPDWDECAICGVRFGGHEPNCPDHYNNVITHRRKVISLLAIENGKLKSENERLKGELKVRQKLIDDLTFYSETVGDLNDQQMEEILKLKATIQQYENDENWVM